MGSPLTFKSVVKTKPKCGSRIGFQFHTPGTKENFLSRKKFGKKNQVLTKNYKFLEFSKRLS